MAYMNVVPPPAQPPQSLLCRTVKLDCPAPVVQNPDALAALYAPLAARVQGYTPFRGIATLSGYRGMGCAGGQCHCGGKCKHGMGLFDSGMNVAGWGVPEWGLAGLGAFALFNLISPRIASRRKAARFRRVKERLDF